MAATTEYRLTIDDLPSPEREKECTIFESKLCKDPITHKLEPTFFRSEDGWDREGSPLQGDNIAIRQYEGVVPSSLESSLVRRPTHSYGMPSLTESKGEIGQETLTQVIAHDELDPRRKRAASWLSNRIDWSMTLPYPAGMSITCITVCSLMLSLFDRYTARRKMDPEPVWPEAPRYCHFHEPCSC